MAKRRSESGKTGKHQQEDYEYSYDYAGGNKRRNLFLVIVVIAVALMLIISAVIVFMDDEEEEPEEKDIILTTDTPVGGGLPMEEITFDFTIFVEDSKPDIFSPILTGISPLWNITIPSTVSVGGGQTKEEQFTIEAGRDTINGSYPFTLEVTSANTQRTYTLDYEAVIFQAFYGIEMFVFNDSHDADPGNYTHYGLIIRNLGNGEDTISLSYAEDYMPSGWTMSFEQDTVDIPLHDSRVVIVNITTSASSEKGRYDIQINATSSGGPKASVWLYTYLVKDFGNETIEWNGTAQVNYIGYYIDGVIFDTSVEEVAKDDNFTKEPGFNVRPVYEPLKMFVGSNDTNTGDDYNVVIVGFYEGVLGMKVNETRVVRMPPEKAYPDGKWRIFEITLISIDG